MPLRTATVVVFGMLATFAPPRPAAGACAGDCNGDGVVAINELVLGVGVALGGAALEGCAAMDGDGDRQVAINELIAAVNAALGGCGAATPGPTPTATPGSGAGSGRVVFAHNGPTFSADLYLINADGSGRVQLTNTEADSESQPVWSPDGSRIAFIDNAGISVMNADGSGRGAVAAGNPRAAYPAWSPDGAEIVFVGGTFNQIEVVGADGGNRRPVLGPDGFEYGAPCFSPDGRRIAFVSNRPDGGFGDALEIFAMNADGSGVTRVTDDATENAHLDWSAGDELLFDSSRPSGGGVFRLDAAGGAEVLVAAGGLFGKWSRDGARFAYSDFSALRLRDRDGSGDLAIPNTTFDDTAPDVD